MNFVQFASAAAGVLLLAACGGATPTQPSAAAPRGQASAAARPSAAKPSGPASAGPAASGLTNVKVGFSQLTGSEAVLYLAADRKFFQKYGIQAEVSRVQGTAMPPAMQSGELQFGTIGGSELVSVNVGGLPMVMLVAAHNVPVFSL